MESKALPTRADTDGALMTTIRVPIDRRLKTSGPCSCFQFDLLKEAIDMVIELSNPELKRGFRRNPPRKR